MRGGTALAMRAREGVMPEPQPQQLNLEQQLQQQQKKSQHQHGSHGGRYPEPYFDPNGNTNITTQLGAHVHLPCRVRQISNKSVSWIRHRDAHILTVDRYTFIADDRFQSFLVESASTWNLQIKYVQERDAGVYECQVNADPKLSHRVTLIVIVPKVEIVGETERFVKEDSQVNVKCVVTQSLESPSYIFWYHNGRRILENGVPRKSIKTESIGSDTTISTFSISSARKEDLGNYTCQPTNLGSAQVVLHVLNGEHPAAMRKNNACGIPFGLLGPVLLGFIIRKLLLHEIPTLADMSLTFAAIFF
ncbi:zwei Ig domain protein zig-8 isoform X2 [Nilaparvata lugens]|uniref:zwei Ig domain protein zig-8 isoform X2 n=1 Tax=Nilaparvata lugens TaxID=108931 RepID=UPI00193E3D72|nr:zwei Ig domain protein zig-8 isoform X2 [Nilaparvata lugens]